MYLVTKNTVKMSLLNQGRNEIRFNNSDGKCLLENWVEEVGYKFLNTYKRPCIYRDVYIYVPGILESYCSILYNSSWHLYLFSLFFHRCSDKLQIMIKLIRMKKLQAVHRFFEMGTRESWQLNWTPGLIMSPQLDTPTKNQSHVVWGL